MFGSLTFTGGELGVNRAIHDRVQPGELRDWCFPRLYSLFSCKIWCSYANVTNRDGNYLGKTAFRAVLSAVISLSWKQTRMLRNRSGSKTYVSNFTHHDFVQIGKQHSWYKAILSSIVLSQPCCEVYFIFLTVVNSKWDLTNNHWNSPPQPYWLDPPLLCNSLKNCTIFKNCPSSEPP